MANEDLLPPDDGLLLPADEPRGEAADLFDQMSGKVAAGARILGARASEIAVEQGPALKEQAQKLGTKMLDAAAQAQDPGFWKKYRSRFLGGAAVLVLLAAGGYEIGCYKAREIARDAVDGYLIRNHLQQELSYKDVSATPFGEVTLSGLRFESPLIGQPVEIASLSISGLSPKGAMPDHLAIGWTGLTLPARSFKGMGPELTSLIGSGYQTLNGEGDFSLDYDPGLREVTLKTAGRFTDFARWDFGITFANFNGAALANAAPQGAPLFGPDDPLHRSVAGGVATLMTIEVKSVNGSLDLSGLAKRLGEIPHTALPADKPQPLFEPQTAQTSTLLVQAGMAPSKARETADALETFAQTGAEIRLKSQMDHPVPLFTAGGFLQPQAFNLPALLAATKISLSN